ncbi:MAG: T9SS type A sorting domain-containing protein [Bacteroidales bacterium]
MRNRILILILILGMNRLLWSQHAPIANDDYRASVLGNTITMNVVKNDTHPDGLYFKISGISTTAMYTDSTITFSIDYDKYCNVADTIQFSYFLQDINGNMGEESFGHVYITIENNEFYNFLDYNNIRARVQASGLQFYSGPISGNGNTDDKVFEFPKASGKNTIYNSTLWVGGFDESNNLKLAAELYRQVGLDYWTGPLSTDGDSLFVDTSTAVKWQKVWKLTSDEIVYHILHYRDSGYQIKNEIDTWPAHGDQNKHQARYLAPFVDVDGDSIYNPMQGDYPIIRGDQCIFYIINDLRPHLETGGEALGIEIHGMAYEYYHGNSNPLDNTVFYSFKIFNRSVHTYRDTYIGLFTDIEIGNSNDDFVGCDVSRGVYYGYNGDSIDGNGEAGTYGNNTPAQGIVILGGPKQDANGLDDPASQCDESINGVGFGDGIADSERYGMKKFLWFNNSLGIQGDPTNDLDYYNYLKSIWKDGTAMEYGGNGHVLNGAYGPFANFMFPGLSDPCYWGTNGIEPFGPVNWTEVAAGNSPGDRRGLSVMGPFTFEPGSMERVDIAYVAAFRENEKTVVETMLSYVDSVRAEYIKDPTYFGYQWLDVKEQFPEDEANPFQIFPNPSSGSMTITYNPGITKARYILSDLMGRVLISDWLDRSGSQTIDVSNLKSGLYIVTFNSSLGSNSVKVIKQ